MNILAHSASRSLVVNLNRWFSVRTGFRHSVLEEAGKGLFFSMPLESVVVGESTDW